MKTFAKLDENNILEFAPKVKGSIINYNLNQELVLADGYKELIKAELPSNDRMYEIIYTENENNIIETISFLESEEEYEQRINAFETNAEIDILNSQIKEIDLKRIRAICEPSVKNEETGETWLDYYNAQILELRQQINQLKGTTNDITN